MVALILAAGYGTRLYPLTKEIPKALLPIKDRTILQHLMEKLTSPALGIQELVFVSNHRYASAFDEWLDSFQHPLPWRLLDDGSTAEENRLGSIGDLTFAVREAKIDADLLVVGSDNLFQDPLDGFLQFAKEKSPALTLGVHELPDRAQAHRYGVLQVDSQWRIVDFQEKPAHPTSPLISTAIYFFPRRTLPLVLEYAAAPGANQDTLGSFIRWLVQQEKVYAYRLQGSWFDIGDIDSYKNAQEQFIP
jgi:glucose-1-phosphate thymidylyltransferase